MRLRMKIYGILVNRVPAIQTKYHNVRDHQTNGAGRLRAWILLLAMNLAWLFGWRYDSSRHDIHPDLRIKIPSNRSESSLSLRESPEMLASRLMKHDVISFDLFDTLVLRPFEKPADLFFIVGEKLGYLDFRRIRMEMEQKARADCCKTNGHREVTLAQIYDYMEKYAGIPAKQGMQAEIDTELDLCFANPYIKEVLCRLKGKNRKIVAVSDMYLPADILRRIVEKCGYTDISEYFVSCEHGASKADGTLFRRVRERLGKSGTFIHTGDNYGSDIRNAGKAGWDAVYYRNVNDAGEAFRAKDMSAVAGSLYRGIVNSHIHNGLKEYSQQYEWGFIYGGIFVLGYCQFIHEYVRTHEIDKILFLARDGDILYRVYRMLYPEESGEEKTAYVYWSRLAAAKMAARYFKYDYFRRFLDQKVNQNYTLEQIFSTMELQDMLARLPLAGKKPTTGKIMLTDRNVAAVKEFLIENWEEVLAHYSSQTEAGRRYYSKVLEGCAHVAAVDVGWAGSGAVTLTYIIQNIWKLECEVTGLLAGTGTAHNLEPDISESQLYQGKLVSYMYSQQHNRNLWKYHNANQGHNLWIEALLASGDKSFRGFAFGNCRDEVKFIFQGDGMEYAAAVNEGVLDFVYLFTERASAKMPGLQISGSDAYAPSAVMCNGIYQIRVGGRTCVE